MPRSDEYHLQVHFVSWLDALNAKGLDILYSATCGGLWTGKAQAIRMKRSGYRKGCPDIIIFEPAGGWHGMAIEVKAKNTKVKDHQKEWKKRLGDRGYYSVILPKGLDHIEALDWMKNQFIKYISGRIKKADNSKSGVLIGKIKK